MMHHNRSIGIYTQERLAVFGLRREVGFWEGKLKSGELNPMAQPDAAAASAAREGMALYRVADDLYFQRRYRVHTSLPGVALGFQHE